ncbi:MAG: NAD(+)/NADH kinase [Nitriliruptoraceae bacterium]
MTTRSVGLVIHAGREGSILVAARAAELLRARGVKVVVADDSRIEEGQGDRLADVAPIVDAATFSSTVDLAISFGGDGTFLRAAHLCRPSATPILGVNLGRLGFLAEIEVDDLDDAMSAVADGRWIVERRSTLTLSIDVDGRPLDPGPASGTGGFGGWALNEVSVEKTARQRLLLMDVSIGGQLFARMSADALVVATSTGSTAYALSAGGPILSPRIDATLVVPVAPHSLFDRTVVAAPDEPVEVQLVDDQPPALVSCDGRDPREVPAGARIVVRGGGSTVPIARLSKLEFFGLVRRKFGLS